MEDYFLLQYHMINRKIGEYGLHPAIGYILLGIVFLFVSSLLFDEVNYAPFIYPLVPFYFTLSLTGKDRNDFIQNCFDKEYHWIRITENTLIVFPFVLFLLYHGFFVVSGLAVAAVIISSFFSFKTSSGFVIPTPFGKRPFEFAIGFRNSFYLFIISYGITIIACFVDNFNLGIFCLCSVFAICCCYYFKPENSFYVWQYRYKPAKFLLHKIKTAHLYASKLSLPIILTLLFLNISEIDVLLLFLLLNYSFLTLIVCAKYASYPAEMGIWEGIWIVITLFFPPLLVIAIPYFFYKSTQQLKVFLK